MEKRSKLEHENASLQIRFEQNMMAKERTHVKCQRKVMAEQNSDSWMQKKADRGNWKGTKTQD